MRALLILFSIIFSFSNLQASEVSEWFKKESNQFLEIINNNEGTENENYEKYTLHASYTYIYIYIYIYIYLHV